MSGLKRKTGETVTQRNSAAGPDEIVANRYLGQKLNRVAKGNLLQVGEITHRTPPGLNMVDASQYSTPVTLNIPKTAVNPGGSRPLVNPREIKFDIDVNYMAASGTMRMSESGGVMHSATSTESAPFFTKDNITFYDTEAMANTYSRPAFSSVQDYSDILYGRKPPVASGETLQNPGLYSAYSPALANNTRLEMLESVEMRFNASTTMLKVTKPGRLYSHVNDCYASKATSSNAVGEITTCPTQWLNYQLDHRYLTEALGVESDVVRHAAGTWFQNLPIGGRTIHSIYLCDLFPAFDKEELMEMPEFTITFNWVSDYREKFLTMLKPAITVGPVATPVTSVIIPNGVEYPYESYNIDSAAVIDTAVRAQEKALFSIHGITYRAPTYASPDVVSPRMFENTYTDYEITEFSIQSTDPTVRIVKTLSRPPKGAIILFEKRDADPQDYKFSRRYWEQYRQVVRITATRAGGLIHQGTNETMQWQGTAGRRMLRAPLMDAVNEFVGKPNRTNNDTAVMHASQFIKNPFLVVNFDNQVDEPQTITKAGKFANFSPDDYTITLEFDKWDTSYDPSEVAITSDMMGLRKLLIIYVYDHTFMTDGDTVTTTKIN